MQQMPGRDAYLDGLLGLADADSALKDARGIGQAATLNK